MMETYTPPQKERSSNIELMRIVLMLLIIMHHYVVNSGVMDAVPPHTFTANVIFLQFWGMWGKMAINAFVMVSGYFLCVSHLPWQKYVKLLLQIMFYQIILYGILLGLGYASLSVKEIAQNLFALLAYAGNGFTASFMMFYLFVPFLNKMINVLNTRGEGVSEVSRPALLCERCDRNFFPESCF